MALWTSRHQQRDPGSRERATGEIIRKAGHAVPNLRGIRCLPDEAGSVGTGALRPRDRGFHRRATALRRDPPFRMSLKTRIFRSEAEAFRGAHRSMRFRRPNLPIGEVPPMPFSYGTSWPGCELIRCQPCKRKGQLWLKVTRTDSISSSVPSWSSWCCCLSLWAAVRVAAMPRLTIRQRRLLRQTPELKPRQTVPLPTHRQLTHRQLLNKRDDGVIFSILSPKSIQGGASLRQVFSNACRTAPPAGIGGAWSPVLFFGAFPVTQTMIRHTGSDAQLSESPDRPDGLNGGPPRGGNTPCAAHDRRAIFRTGNRTGTSVPALSDAAGISDASCGPPGLIWRSGSPTSDDNLRQRPARMALTHVTPFPSKDD